MINFSIIIPVYNEGNVIRDIINEIRKTLTEVFPQGDYEIIVVNDGSTDQSYEILKEIVGIKLINNSYNKGYGASIKSAARNAKNEWLIWFDADGQHKPEYIKKLVKEAESGNYDMVVGERQKYKGPLLRQPGKKILTWISNYLMESKITDINSGLRIMKKQDFNRFAHLYPNSFSISTTITLAFLKDGLNIKYIPIDLGQRDKRTSKSTVKPLKHGWQTILLILRVIMLFNPLKIFMPICIILFLLGSIFSLYGVIVFGRFPISGALVL
ncbi:MAG: glycosyltransferase family 2 protein, partial [Patescibacteria group bacterium]